MEEQNFSEPQQNTSGGVSFPSVNEVPKKNNGVKTLLIAGILILIGVLGFIIFKSASKKSETISIESSNEDELTTPVVSQTVSPSETPVSSSTPKPSNKSAVTIDVQNGTGITGEAAYLQNLLKDMGYTKVSVSNASTQDATVTTITFSKSVSADVSDEITKKLQSVYKEVSIKEASSQISDVVIVTGVRKGSTSKPSATTTPKPSSTPTASPKPTSTP